MKERDPQLFFELTDLMAERWLTEMQLLGGAAEVQRFAERDNVAKVTQLHPSGEAYSSPAALARASRSSALSRSPSLTDPYDRRRQPSPLRPNAAPGIVTTPASSRRRVASAAE